VDEATCPVCNERVQGSVEELNSHVEMCLRKVSRRTLILVVKNLQCFVQVATIPAAFWTFSVHCETTGVSNPPGVCVQDMNHRLPYIGLCGVETVER
jgi:hypothetical protein